MATIDVTVSQDIHGSLQRLIAQVLIVVRKYITLLSLHY